MEKQYVIKRINSDITHHGIKGQKWGVRRFQKKDGTLTPAGKKRYADEETVPKKSKHRQSLEANYRTKGMTAEEAEIAASKRIKIEKTIAITAGLTVAACGAYYAKNKWIADRTDQILKAGTTFHNLDSKPNLRPGEHLYVNYRQNDRNFFNGKFALGKLARSGHVFEHRIPAVDDVKIPSLKTRQSVFKQLYEQDPQFKAAMQSHSGMTNDASASKVYKNMWQKFGDKDTKDFNEAKSKYFKALIDKGYGAIVDEWDTNRLVYRSDAPLILLDTKHKSLGKMTIRELKTNDILTAQANSHGYKFKNDLLNAISAPHTNHFKESTKHLQKYSSLNDKNKQYIEDVLFKVKYENGLFNRNDRFSKHQSFKENGKAVAYAGKYLSKNKNMSVNEAIRKGQIKKDRIDKIQAGAIFTVGYTVGSAPLVGANYVYRQRQIDNYRAEHPNTKMSNTQILRTLNYN